MPAPNRARVLAILAMAALGGVVAVASPTSSSVRAEGTEQRAVSFLSIEVPRWRSEHPCYSCHNNGDGLIALLAASRRGLSSGNAMDDTLAWMKSPEAWTKQGGPVGLRPLLRIHFATTLAVMADAGRTDRTAMESAAALVANDQTADGSWPTAENGYKVSPEHPEASPNLGSPVALGTTLATASARLFLAQANSQQFRPALAKADTWLRSRNVASVMDASSVLYGLDHDRDPQAMAQRKRCLEILKSAQKPDGGWGPTVDAASQSFDTALAILVLSNLRSEPTLAAPAYSSHELRASIEKARDYLVQKQENDGSWEANSRPPVKESYARRISTTAWALRALLASEP